MDTKAPDNPTTQFYRLYGHLVLRARNGGHPERSGMRGDLNLCRDGAQHRRYHGFHGDLLN